METDPSRPGINEKLGFVGPLNVLANQRRKKESLPSTLLIVDHHLISNQAGFENRYVDVHGKGAISWQSERKPECKETGEADVFLFLKGRVITEFRNDETVPSARRSINDGDKLMIREMLSIIL